jgi:hypothetical protein
MKLHWPGTYEENELMKAEALIQTGQVDLGVQSIDKVRAYQGAGLARSWFMAFNTGRCL